MDQTDRNHGSATEIVEKLENTSYRFSDLSDISNNSGTSSVSGISGISAFSSAHVRDAANGCLPENIKDVNRTLFKFARAMRTMFPDASLDEMEPCVAIWYKVAVVSVSELDWGEVICDFEFKLEAVKYPLGEDPLSLVLKEVEVNEPPACSTRWGGKLGRLVHILQRLQMKDRNNPIYMSGKMADKLIHAYEGSSYRMFKKLARHGIVEVVVKGNEHRATRYRYLGDF